MDTHSRIKALLARIYGPRKGDLAFSKILPLIEAFPRRPRRKAEFFSQDDVALITYGDTLLDADRPPLAVMGDFVRTHLRPAVSMVHLLPFFPWSSDDGFAVKDFQAVDPRLGTWADVAAIGRETALMFDLVINHFSSRSEWFANYLAGRPGFCDIAIEVDPDTDLSGVTRPRSLPLLSPFTKHDGRQVHLWTTFSADQIDFNYGSPEVLERMIGVLLFYAAQGAAVLRLDAIAYLWKEIGTPCVHLDQTHAVVQLFRTVLDRVAPDVMLLTETNVPHAENISYFGDGRNEAQMVYNFTLPPLLLHAFFRQDVGRFNTWAASLAPVSASTTFFNFTASHDGIGVRPLEGILPPSEIAALVGHVRDSGGEVSTKRNRDGSDSPYELNITYVDAVVGDEKTLAAERFLASQSIQYVLPGVPATYLHSLLGSRNWRAGVAATGRARSINRQKLRVKEVAAALQDPHSFRSRVFGPFIKMMALRRRQPAFHPNATFDVLPVHPRVFAIRREKDTQTLVALTNISRDTLHLEMRSLGLGGGAVDLFSGRRCDHDGRVDLGPYRYVWLEPPRNSNF